MVAASWSAGHFLVVVVPGIVDCDEEFEAVDLWRKDAHTCVREEGFVITVAQVVVLLAAPFVVDAHLDDVDRCPNRTEGHAVIGIIERVEAGVDAVIAIVFVFIKEGVAGDGLDCVPALGADQLDAESVDVNGVGGSCCWAGCRISPVY